MIRSALRNVPAIIWVDQLPLQSKTTYINNKMNDEPLVSIVVPVKNGAKFVVETLDSVFEQSYKNIEVIVIDDNSTDHTLELLSNMKMKDNRLKFSVNDQGSNGAPVCRNLGYRMAIGKYIIFLDADDLLKQDCVEHRVAFF